MNLFGATPKYTGTATDPIDGTPISWRAHPDGFPIRAGDSPLTVDKAQASHATTTLFARSEVLEIPKDLKRYVEVMDWVINTTGTMPEERIQQVGDGKWVVWLVWADVRGYIPKNPFPGLVGRD